MVGVALCHVWMILFIELNGPQLTLSITCFGIVWLVVSASMLYSSGFRDFTASRRTLCVREREKSSNQQLDGLFRVINLPLYQS